MFHSHPSASGDELWRLFRKRRPSFARRIDINGPRQRRRLAQNTNTEKILLGEGRDLRNAGQGFALAKDTTALACSLVAKRR